MWSLVSMWLGDTPRAVELLNGAKTAAHASICEQIARNGSLPAEEARVNSIGYVLMDMRGLLNLAQASRFPPFVASGGARDVGDLYSFVCPSGASIRATLDYLLPYAVGERPWPYPSETADYSGAVPLFKQGAVVWHSAAYAGAAARIKGASDTDLSELWWRAPSAAVAA